MPAKLKINIIADPLIPVPPQYYGGIERIIHNLIIELQQRGHSVSLFAHADSSSSPAKFYPYPSTEQNTIGIIRNTIKTSQLLFSRPDIVHSFGRLAYLSLLLPTNIPKIMSYQREPTISQIRKAARLTHQKNLLFTGCSDYITNQIRPFAPTATVYNAVSMEDFHFTQTIEEHAPLVFLGRIEPIKGPHHAISVALETKRRLIIAGNVPANAREYFETRIAPFIDNKQISYIGEVDDKQKDTLLGSAAALLMPVEWNEPFGIVMAEALACGTPVIALKGGATTEVVRNGINGFICNDVAEMAKAVQNITLIDRLLCRQDAEQRFSSQVMAEHYEALYFNMLKKT